MIRLKDIAQRAGVSVMTVSKVLRDAPDISAATKDRVGRLAREMGYVPDGLAQSLRTRKTRLIGVVISTIMNPIFARVLTAIEQRAFEAGFEVVFCQSFNQVEREERVLRRLLERRVEGLLVSPVYRLEPEAPVFQHLHERQVPTVILGHSAPFCRQFVPVETDDLQAGYEVASHLIQLGHRRIAFLSGPLQAPWAQERIEGYRRALREHQIPTEDRWVFQAGTTIEEGSRAVEQLLTESATPTAIQAVNDLVAMGAGQTLLARGFRIPQDISLAGFGNFMASEFFRVPLTTVRQPKMRLGQAAMDALIALMAGRPVEPKRLPAELIVRDSSGPPARNPTDR
ncbi:MAG: LacI family DNA-binding transcriptional regulator [Verrucomicrobia bacterium]|nr:LacI family DNA-binding transcriptional regulator [Verrucomicrobiota bacterium]